MSLYSKWSKKEHTFLRRVLVSLLAGVIFAYLLPLAVTRGGSFLDHRLGLPSFHIGMVNYLLGGFLMIMGFSFALWSFDLQLSQGRGTPLPMLPTQVLLTEGPYRYCRNPMTFGAILAYLGFGVFAGTTAGIGMVLCFAVLLVLYLKLLEEKELAERFGEAYLAYKRDVPFIIPRLPKRQ